MQGPQLELGSAEPHPIPQLYPQLTPSQQERLVHHLAELMLQLVQAGDALPQPRQPTPDHE